MKIIKEYAKHLALAVCCMLALTSCKSFVPKRKDVAANLLPSEFSQQNANTNYQQQWWQEFKSPELDQLMKLAFKQNLSLEQARARLDQAQARARMAGAPLYPSVSAKAGAGRTKIDKPELGLNSETDNYSMGLSASYEIDLWGRVRFGRKSALMSFQASQFDLQTAAVTLAGQIATTWVDITGQQAQEKLLDQQLATAKTYLSLVQMRFKSAMVSALDVYQQKQNVARIEAEIPLVQARIKLLYTALSVLTATPVDKLPKIKQSTLASLPSMPATGLPAQLLENRPDIKASLYRLQSSDYTAGQTHAARLPAISINATGTFESQKTQDLFDNWLLNLAGNLTAPIIDGGFKRAQRDLALATSREKLAAYKLSILEAVRDVENALSQEDRQIAHLKALKQQNEFARNALEQAQQRYRKGLNDYLPVLTALSTTQSLDNALILRKMELLKYRINLCKAIGGTWPQTMLNPTTDTDKTKVKQNIKKEADNA